MNNVIKQVAAVALSVFAFAGSQAKAAVITVDFEDMSFGAVPGDELVLNKGGLGITFQGTGLEITAQSLFTDTYGAINISTQDFVQPLTVNLANLNVTAVQLVNPKLDDSIDPIATLFVQAFNAADVLVDSITTDNDLISLSGSGITRLLITTSNSERYAIGSFAFTVVPRDPKPVPEPGALVLLAIGAGLVPVFRRKRQ